MVGSVILLLLRGGRRFSTTPSNLYTKYSFTPPTSLSPSPSTSTSTDDEKPSPTLTLTLTLTLTPPHTKTTRKKPPIDSKYLPPFDFRFSYTESSPSVRPIGLREPKYSPFGPHTLDRPWTGVCAPALLSSQLEAKTKMMRDTIQGHQLTNAETLALLNACARHKTKRQINLGRDGLTHNMLNDIHNNWKHAEAVRIKCMGVPTVDMKNVCMQLEDKAFGKIIHRHGGSLVLYRGRNYNPKKRPVIPLMLWKPQEPIYPKLIKTTIEGLSIQETKQMRKKGLAVPALTKLAKNGYYGGLVPMIRDAFLVEELVRIDCQGLEKKDYKKLGSKLRDLVPCILVTFEKEQIVVWRGKDYKPREGGCFLTDRESFDKSDTNPGQESEDVNHGQIEFDSEDEE